MSNRLGIHDEGMHAIVQLLLPVGQATKLRSTPLLVAGLQSQPSGQQVRSEQVVAADPVEDAAAGPGVIAALEEAAAEEDAAPEEAAAQKDTAAEDAAAEEAAADDGAPEDAAVAEDAAARDIESDDDPG